MASSSSPMPAIDAETFYALSTRVEELSHRIQILEVRDGNDPASQPKVRDSGPFSKDRIDQAIEITKGLFSGPLETRVTADPSEPQSPFLVFRVEQTLKHEEFRERMHRWHDAMAALWPSDLSVYRLMVDPAR